MKRTKLKPGEIRVINIGQQAIMEWLSESMTEHVADFFDVKDSCGVLVQCNWDQESNQFTCVVERKEEADGRPIFRDFDYAAIREKVGETTDTLFAEGRYQTLNIQEDPSLLE